jgi:hypothetical protein
LAAGFEAGVGGFTYAGFSVDATGGLDVDLFCPFWSF